MKLAEALQERAFLNRTIEQVKSRLMNNALIQEGEEPSENPRDLKNALDKAIDRLEYLIAHINKTNSETVVDGKTLTEMISEKDALIIKISAYQDIISSASQSTYRARGSEIKIKPSIDISAWQKEADKISKEIRELDNKLQSSNWLTDLAE